MMLAPYLDFRSPLNTFPVHLKSGLECVPPMLVLELNHAEVPMILDRRVSMIYCEYQAKIRTLGFGS
jgi:hypothetical protein